ncbi:MAG TPA: hypothetical protein VLA24_11410 [Pseudomonadales bacterium]|nr:hypothetical protein [Pseudomonadales bacterium]
MYKTLWTLPRSECIASIEAMREWLLTHLLPRQATLAWIDQEKTERQRWSLNMAGLSAETVMILLTEQPVDLNTAWPSYINVSQGYQLQPTVLMPYPEIDLMTQYPFSLQLCGFKFLPGIPRRQAIEYWREQHASVATSNQNTVTYLQNVVTGQSDGAQDLDGWVEEGFPNSCIGDPLQFFAAEHPHQMQQHLMNITDSTAKFIAMDSLYVQHYSALRLI